MLLCYMTSSKILVFNIALIIVFMVLITGCIQNQNSKLTSDVYSTADTATQAAAITIKDFAFSPANLTVKSGTIVTWTNEDSMSHLISSHGNFESNTLNKGASYNYTFKTIGTYPYICTIHPSMKGTIVVE